MGQVVPSARLPAWRQRPPGGPEGRTVHAQRRSRPCSHTCHVWRARDNPQRLLTRPSSHDLVATSTPDCPPAPGTSVNEAPHTTPSTAVRSHPQSGRCCLPGRAAVGTGKSECAVQQFGRGGRWRAPIRPVWGRWRGQERGDGRLGWGQILDIL